MFDRIVFVGTENTQRSKMADSIYKSLVMDGDVPSISRGLVVLFQEPINEKVERVLENHSIDIEDRTSKQFTDEDYSNNTLVLTMTVAEKEKILKEYNDIKAVYTIKEYTKEDGDVKNLYGGTLVEYEECFNELLRLIKKIIYRLDEERSGYYRR